MAKPMISLVVGAAFGAAITMALDRSEAHAAAGGDTACCLDDGACIII